MESVGIAAPVAGAEAPASPAPAPQQQTTIPAATQPQQAPPARPDWLPEEFSTPEQLAQAYKDRVAGKQPAQEAPKAPLEQAAAAGEADPIEAILTKAGLGYEAMSDHFAEHGELTPEGYKALEGVGFPRQLVDGYLHGQIAVTAAFKAQVLAEVGGRDTFQKAVEWAKRGGLNEDEVAAYNAAVESFDHNHAKQAVQALIARFESNFGASPNLAEGEGGGGGAQGFESSAQLVAAINDPRYAKDPAFRASVERKVALSPGLFTSQQR